MNPWALVPIKNTASAKQRLAGRLSAKTRQALALCMAEDVLTALSNARSLGGIAVMTGDPEAKRLARRFDALVIEEQAALGHTSAVETGTRRLIDDGVEGVMTLPIDIPLTTAEEIDRVVAAHATDGPAFTIVPAHDKMGSNCILRSPPDCIALRFGEDSFYPHLARASSRGIEPRIVELFGIALDIDHPEDLAAFLEVERVTVTGRFLRNCEEWHMADMAHGGRHARRAGPLKC